MVKEKSDIKIRNEIEKIKRTKKIKIVVGDKEKGRVEIPVEITEARDIYDMGYLISAEDEFFKNLKLNKMDKSFWALHEKFAKVVDCLDDGRCYDFDLKPSKHKFYHSGKKPKWEKGGL